MRVFRTEEEKMQEEAKLLATIQGALPRLQELLDNVNDHWTYEDKVYRFYHQSFKVFSLQEVTLELVKTFQELAPHLPLNDWFMEIVKQGTGKEFQLSMNEHWLVETRPIVEAFFHAHFFLEMICKYGRELKEVSPRLRSGWAAVMYLYHIR